ncbi:MAG: hypothetical protein AB2L20_12485 [Mangrovibacterium sp.]
MALFDFLDSGDVRGKCETNFFHMVINDELPSVNFSEYTQKIKGTYIHEYCHYIQFISTIFGITYGFLYNTYFTRCREHFEGNKSISIPLGILGNDPILERQINKFKSLKGAAVDLDIDIQRILLDEKEITAAKENNTGVSLKAFDKNNEERSFQFGYLCIVESMASLLQSFFDEIEGHHPAIPYNGVKLVCQSIYPEIAEDRRLLISICLCSLHYNNPGAGFFEVLNILKENPAFDGRELYHYFSKTSSIIYLGERVTIKDLLIRFIDNYKTNIQAAIQNKLEYFSKVFENVKLEAENFQHQLLYCLYNDEMSSDEKVSYLKNFYGIPFIESSNLYIMPKRPEGDLPYIDIVYLRGLEIVINRFTPQMTTTSRPYDPKCDMYERCYATQYPEDIEEKDRAPMSRDCENKQWNKEEICVMTNALKWLTLWGKEINQPHLPIDMR